MHRKAGSRAEWTTGPVGAVRTCKMWASRRSAAGTESPRDYQEQLESLQARHRQTRIRQECSRGIPALMLFKDWQCQGGDQGRRTAQESQLAAFLGPIPMLTGRAQASLKPSLRGLL